MSSSREELRQMYQKVDTGEKHYIPAKPKTNPYEKNTMFRVCAYCRVSTDNDEQLSSFELQQAHYKQLVQDHDNWELIHIYADEGISGTSLKNRDAFNQMIEDCKKGMYDLILTKSVSRFARNIVDCISHVRMLKGLNPPVGVFFETDNLYTLDESKEFMLTFLASFAQEESVKKSEAMVWSLTQRFKDGKLLTPALLGYDRPRDVTGRYIKYAPLEINEAEARIVRFIYDAYLSGWTQDEIARFLTRIKAHTKTGGTDWTSTSIRYILTNERYCGDVLTWKTFTSDLYEHKHKRNQQDRDQYLYKNHHDAIISPEKFEAVQVLVETRRRHIRGTLPSFNVIDDGIFHGFVPINHHWVSDDPQLYYNISNSVARHIYIRNIPKRSFSAFNLDGYQVVRNQFTQARYEGPALNCSSSRIGFNMYCMRKFEEISYIQLLLHPTERKIAIRPCNSDSVNRIKWRPNPDKPLYPKSISCPHFGAALFSIMEWNPDYNYKIRGTWAQRGHEQIIVFDLSKAVPAAPVNDSQKRKKHMDLVPEEWVDDFGDEFYDHVMDNEFYYLKNHSEWHTYAASIPAPGVKQFYKPDVEELQKSMDTIAKGAKQEQNGQ